MKALLITSFVLTLGSMTYAQTDSTPAANSNCKEQSINKKAKKAKVKQGPNNTQASAAERAVCPQPSNSAPAATLEAAPAAAAPTPTAALSSTAVAPPADKSQLNVTIYHDAEESLGAAARRIRAKKAAEDAGKTQ